MTSSGHSSPHQKRFNFAESNHKIRMELRQADLRLQKKIELMEKQTYTTTNNISNHQQVLKNSWRRLEQKRMQDQMSPLGSRRTKKTLQPVDDSKKRLMFSNKTYLSMEVTSGSERSNNGMSSPQTHTRPFTQASRHRYRDDLSSGGSLPFLQERAVHNGGGQPRDRSNSGSLKHLPPIATSQLQSSSSNGMGPSYIHMQRSPYISSPYAFRRQHDQTKPFSSKSLGRVAHPLTNVSSTDSRSAIQLTNGTPEGSGTDLDSEKDSNQKTDGFPPLDASMNTRGRTLNISAKTVSKKALLKAGQILNMDSNSHGSMPFKKFYETSNSASSDSHTQLITLDELEGMTEDDLMDALTEEEQEQLKTAKEEVPPLLILIMYSYAVA